jgi:polysaccharide biosynthesis protein PslH
VKILFLTPQYPYPADQGTKLRNSHLIRLAAEAGQEIDLLTFRPEQQAEPETAWCRRIVTVPAPRERSLGRRLGQLTLSGNPDLVMRLHTLAFRGALGTLLRKKHYDVVQVEGLELSGYLAELRGQRVIFDAHNAEFLLQRRAYLADRGRVRRAHRALYSFIQWGRLRAWEAQVCRGAEVVLAASEPDARALERLSGRPVVPIQNAIELNRFPFQPRETVRPELLFDGTMSFRPNHDAASWFMDEIFPTIRARCPEARFWVVGREPPSGLVAANFRDNGVAVTGEVRSTAPYWERAGVYVLPMRIGGGVRYKALEAMARGCPIVSTKLGMDGTGAVPEVDYLEAQRADDFAAAVVRLLAEPELAGRISANARQTVARHDLGALKPRLTELYDRLEVGRVAI